ncbi:MAG TPA: hypothetical protein VFO16_00620 [Pseudonocardiaceae bacterium]|nr:hypothetical protein [Pseudonocardiaceae bacterium]
MGARVERAGVDARLGAPRLWPHAQAQVTGLSATRLVRSEGEDQRVSIKPHLIPVIPE